MGPACWGKRLASSARRASGDCTLDSQLEIEYSNARQEKERTMTCEARRRIESNSSSVSTKSCLASARRQGDCTAMRTRAARCQSATLAGVERKPARPQRYHIFRKRPTSVASNLRFGLSLADVKKASRTGIRLNRVCERWSSERGSDELLKVAGGFQLASAFESPLKLSEMPVSTKSERSSTTNAWWKSGRPPAAVASLVWAARTCRKTTSGS